jgi:platelet-activating factor acetylhydrolase
VYVAIASLVLAILCDALSHSSARGWVCVLATGAAILGVVGSLVFPLPVNLSRVQGEFQTIGCVTRRLGGVECRVFYPVAYDASAFDATKRVPYVHHGELLARGLSIAGKAPQWFFQPLYSAYYLAAIPDAPSATPSEHTGGWPLVVFSHGLGGSLEIYATIVQELASRGMVVAVLNHCDGSASITRHADGRYETIRPLRTPAVDDGGFGFRNRQLRHRVVEVRRVLDAITALASETSPRHVFHTVDMGNVHVAGHSFGAATALSAAHKDERFRSAMLHDAFMMPVFKGYTQGLGDRIPVLHLVSEQFLVDRQQNMDAIKIHWRGCTHPRSELLVLRKSHHNNFTDLPQFSPFVTRTMRAAGAIDPYYTELAIAEVSAAFVSRTRSTRDVQKQFPEVVEVDV